MNEESAIQGKVVWNGVWSLRSPNKVKNQIWRAYKNSMPTKANLFQRTIIDSPSVKGVRQPQNQYFIRYGSVQFWMRSGLMQVSGVSEERLHLKALKSWFFGLYRITKMQSCLR